MKWKIPSNVKLIDWHYVYCYMPDGTTSVEIPQNATVPDDFRSRENLTELVISEGVSIGHKVFENSAKLIDLVVPKRSSIASFAFNKSGLKKVVIHEGADVSDNAFYGCNSLILIVVPDSYLKDFTYLLPGRVGRSLPAFNLLPPSTIVVTHKTYNEMNDFYSKYGFQDLELQDKINIYGLCHNSNGVSQEIFSRLSHLSVSTILKFIQTYSEISRNVEQSKQLLAWTMGTNFVNSFNDKEASDVNKMIAIAAGDGNGALASVQQYLTVKDYSFFTRMVMPSNTSQSAPSNPLEQMLFCQRKESDAAAPNLEKLKK